MKSRAVSVSVSVSVSLSLLFAVVTGCAPASVPPSASPPASAAAPAAPSQPPTDASPPSTTAPSPASTSAAPAPASSSGSTSLDLPAENGSSGCNLSVFGGANRRAFDAFDSQLRSAAERGDANAFADLVLYPLRVNRDRRTVYVRSRAELVKDAALVFTPSVRRDIERQEGFFCRDIGLMYGGGTVWVQVVPAAGGKPERYAVAAVNVPEIDPTKVPSRAAPEVKLRCVAPADTVLVEDLGDALRYRSWRRGTPPAAKPDLVVQGGTVTYEGTGACAHAIYTFENGDTAYEVSELGCTDGSEPPGTTGRLRVSRHGSEIAAWLCRGDARATETPSGN